MSKSSLETLLAQGDLKPGSEVNTVKYSGHQLCLDNPIGCTASVLGFVFGSDVKEQFLVENPEVEPVRDERVGRY
jgi:hypothetical protein